MNGWVNGLVVVLAVLVIACSGNGAQAQGAMRRAPYERVTLNSSAICEVLYDRAGQKLWVRFPAGTIYAYADVTEATFQALCIADSPGRYFHAHIRKAHAVLQHIPAPKPDASDAEHAPLVKAIGERSSLAQR